jgi:hypothetical protein
MAAQGVRPLLCVDIPQPDSLVHARRGQRTYKA